MLATSSASKADARPTRLRTLIHIAFAFSGMAALIYEVVWTRQLQLVFGSTVYAVSIMLGAFMAGLSLGSFIGGKYVDRHKNPIALFGMLELGVGIFGLISIPLIQLVPSLYFIAYNTIRGSLVAYVIIQLLITFLIMLGPTTLMGATFPVVSKINTVSMEELGEDVGGVYSVNTLGSIVGSLGAGFLLIPLLGVRTTIIIAALINLAVGTTIVWTGRDRRLGRSGAIIVATFLVVLGVSLATPQDAATLTMQLYRSNDIATLSDFLDYKADLQTLYYRDAPEGPVAVFRLPDGALQLRNSGATEGASVAGDVQTMQLAALIPSLAHGDAEDFLVVGLGTGATSVAALELEGTESLVTVEINPAVVEASRFFIGTVLDDDPRSEMVVADARNQMMLSDRTYDVVTSEPSYPLSTHVTQLFTTEFFEIARDELVDDGVICQWFPAYLLERQDRLMMLKTFSTVFPSSYVFVDRSASTGEIVDIFAVSRKNGGRIDVDAVIEGATSGQEDFTLELWVDPAGLAELVSSTDIPIHTDDRPVLEFRTPINHIRALWRKD